MKRLVWAGLILVLVLSLGVTGCGGRKGATAAGAAVEIGRDSGGTAASPADWPRYPNFSVRSCWTRPFGTGVMRALQAATRHRGPPGWRRRRSCGAVAPSRRSPVRPQGGAGVATADHTAAPARLLRRRSSTREALWAYIAVPAATGTLRAHSKPERVVEQMTAQWETSIVQGALRDDFCAAGGRSLVGSTAGRGAINVSDRGDALLQQFPEPLACGVPPPRRARRPTLWLPHRLAATAATAPDCTLAGHRNRPRAQSVRPRPAGGHELLDPISNQAAQTAVTFEGFMLVARDRHGPFVSVENVYRGEVEGGQWSRNRCAYPYDHSEPFGAKPCR